MPSVEQNKIKRSGIGLRACDRDRAFDGLYACSRHWAATARFT